MVADRRLELRVAFRVHSRTGRPLGIDSVADGYVHMKFGILRHRIGDRLYPSGSPNESAQILGTHAVGSA
jgi:hypothetical protein